MIEARRIKEEKIKQRDRLKKVNEEQKDKELREELFSKLQSFKIEKSKEN